MKNIIFAILFSASFSLSASAADCGQVAKSVKSQIAGDKDKVLEVVSKEVAATPECAGEIVKAAILASHASAQMVGAIVEAAVIAAPDHIVAISNSALAVAPDAFNEVQAVITRLAAFLGKPNPLNFPGKGPVVPNPGGSGGKPGWAPGPPVIIPPVTTRVNP